MNSRLVVLIGLAGWLMAAPPALAQAADCCADKMQASHADCGMPCCTEHKGTMVMPDSVLTDPFFLALQTEPPAPPVAARQSMVVWFNQPVRIGNNILQGRYVIEHDNDRMAAGGPCTYVYAFEDQAVPVVAFHCVHLDRAGVDKATVVLAPGPDGFKRLVEFQFPSDTGGHGTPTVR